MHIRTNGLGEEEIVDGPAMPGPHTSLTSGGPTLMSLPGWTVSGAGLCAPVASFRTSAVGLVFDEALDLGSYTAPQPAKYRTVVYQLHRKRWNDAKFWEKETDFVEDTEIESEMKAKQYIANKGWRYLPFNDKPSEEYAKLKMADDNAKQARAASQTTEKQVALRGETAKVPDIQVQRLPGGGAAATLTVPVKTKDGTGCRTIGVVMKPGEVEEVRRRVEALAAAQNMKVQGFLRGESKADPDALLEPSATGRPAADPDAILPPTKGYGRKPAAKATGKTVAKARVLMGPATFKKLVHLGDDLGSAVMWQPTAGGIHCIRLPNGSIQPTRIFHCAPASQAAGCLCSGEFKILGDEDVLRIAGAHVRTALLGRLQAKAPNTVAWAAGKMADARRASVMGVTGFKAPAENFVDDASHEEQMYLATKSGPNLMDKMLHDGMYGEVILGLEPAAAKKFGAFVNTFLGGDADTGDDPDPRRAKKRFGKFVNTFLGESIEDGVMFIGDPAERPEILSPEEIMEPPSDLLESETLLDEHAAVPKSTFISSKVMGDHTDLLGTSLGRLEEIAAEQGDGADLGWGIPGVKSLKKLGKSVKKGVVKRTKQAAHGIAKTAKAVDSSRMNPLGSRMRKGMAAVAKQTAKDAYKYSGAKAAVALTTKAFVPSRDAQKRKMVQDLNAQLTKQFATFAAYQRGSRAPTPAEIADARVKSQALLAKHKLPTDMLGWTAAGLTEIPVAAWRAAGCGADDARIKAFIGRISMGRDLGHTRRVEMSGDSYRTLAALRGLENEIAIGAATAARSPQRTPGTVLVGSWWNPLSWFSGAKKAVMSEADLIAPDPDSLPPLPEGAGDAPSDEAYASPGSADDGGGEAPAPDEAPAEEAAPEDAAQSAEYSE